MNVHQRQTVFRYWLVLIRMFSGKDILGALGWTLEEATQHAWYTAIWSGVLLFNAWAIEGLPRHFSSVEPLGPPWLNAIVHTIAWLLLSLVTGIATYGILRLFTLVSHVMVTTLFQVRGQRLRLLSLHTATLTLTFPAAIALVLLPVLPILGWSILCLTVSYSLYPLSRGYNVIYHQRRLRGLWLVLGGTLVTGFVFAIGAIAVTVAFGVAGFIVAAIVRPLHHL